MTNPSLAPIVYVPSGPHAGPDGLSSIELRKTDDGRTALLAYSALDRLIACCGDQQPWVLVKSEDLPKIHAALAYDVILLDAELPNDLRYGHQMV